MMRINLNNPEEFNRENVKKLIAEGDNSKNSQYRVDKDGYFFRSTDTGNQNMKDILISFATNFAGDTTVGPDATDEWWVDYIYNSLKRNWPCRVQTYIDTWEAD